ncbi:unnamed protein product [Penicillium nalgiovense]|uniref:STAS domain-containing protein n=1 Tax=Penicillium nalgiovense TaxID=60175 RepID=A0A9W4N0V1_PENNA|nr:unnamed protein product [Penicillium nalgiovense]CAG8032031.1 unnamed protein product [Penicillium nalgiovense]CAG8033756.1 unnamed protein product [Penicillium nalgiovense]CAG8083342.1 unnamed protein product [Penicillium nalgiovense]CAG8084994.1 unnamed protein product [Penicillium nalgiovense]
MDAAMGHTALAILYGIRSACNYETKKNPHKAKLLFFLFTLRTAFVVLFYAMIGAAVSLHRSNNPAFRLLCNMFQLPRHLLASFLEHIAISKSFGRVDNYTIDPSQEFIAIGISNFLGPFLGAYPATGSFSRSAIKAKCGVRTPLAGVITAVAVLLAVYAPPALFFFIPKSSLSAVIIHAVGELVIPPRITYQLEFWRVSPVDALIFLMGVIVIVFSTIETGIYCTIGVSLGVLPVRLAKARGQFLGYIQDDTAMSRIYLPTKHEGGTNPRIKINQSASGIFIYRVSEGFNYPNADHYTGHLVSHIFRETRRTTPQAWETTGDRPWNDPGPTRAERKILMAEEAPTSSLPSLRAIILGFAAVNNVDVTSVQSLIDVRNQLDRWTSPDSVQWHFADIHNRWTKRALATAGFGISDGSGPRWQRSIFNIAEILDGGLSGSVDQSRVIGSEDWSKDLKAGLKVQDTSASSSVMGVSGDDIQVVRSGRMRRLILVVAVDLVSVRSTGMAVVVGINRLFFHVDLTSALKSAMADS